MATRRTLASGANTCLGPWKGADIPYSGSYESTGASVNLDTVWFVGLRIIFDWRYYW